MARVAKVRPARLTSIFIININEQQSVVMQLLTSIVLDKGESLHVLVLFLPPLMYYASILLVQRVDCLQQRVGGPSYPFSFPIFFYL